MPVAVPGQCQGSGGARAVISNFASVPSVLGRQSDVLSPSHHYKFHMLDVSSRIQQPASSYIPHEHMSVVESVFK